LDQNLKMQYAFQFAICQGEGFFRWEGAPAHLRFENKRLISRMQLLWAWPNEFAHVNWPLSIV
jgi:hypothetical protein